MREKIVQFTYVQTILLFTFAANSPFFRIFDTYVAKLANSSTDGLYVFICKLLET